MKPLYEQDEGATKSKAGKWAIGILTGVILLGGLASSPVAADVVGVLALLAMPVFGGLAIYHAVKRTGRAMRWVKAVAVAPVVLIVAVMISTSEKTEPDKPSASVAETRAMAPESPSAAAAPPRVQKAPQPPPIEQPALLPLGAMHPVHKDWAVAIHGYRSLPRLGTGYMSLDAGDGYRFVLVDTRVRNLQTRTSGIPLTTTWRLIDSRGYQYSPESGADVYTDTRLVSTLFAPGETRRGEIVFRVDNNAGGFRVIVTMGISGRGEFILADADL